jgi:uncharacterized protein
MLTTTEFTTAIPAWSTGFMEKSRVFIEYARHPLQMRRWVRFLKQDPVLDALAKTAPHLLSRVHKPYLSPQLGYAARISLLIDHYQIIARLRLGDLMRRSAVRPLILHEFAGKSGTPYQLTLAAVDASRCDGEMTLRLTSQGTVIYVASFVFATIDGAPCVKLGGLQGLLATDNMVRIKHITRDLYGCRPRDLMVYAVCEIGVSAGCGRIVLIGNGNKLPSSARVCRKASNYDEIWKEWHAVRRHDGDYEMSCVRAHGDSKAGDAAPAGEPSRCARLLDTVLAALRARFGREKAAGDFALPAWAQVADDAGERHAAPFTAHAGRGSPQ